MNTIARDERESSIDRAADRLSFIVLAFGVLAVVAYRGLRGEASWELLGLVVVAGLAGAAYRTWKRAASRGWLLAVALTVVAAAVVGVALAVLGRA